MSRGKAPGGAFPPVSSEPAIMVLTPQQGSQHQTAEATPIRIERMLRAINTNEQAVKRWEGIGGVVSGRRQVRMPDEPSPRLINIDEEYGRVCAAREENIAEIRHLIDYALTTEAYEDVVCPDCKPWTMPSDTQEFVNAVPTADIPQGSTALCVTCKGRGAVRKLRTDLESEVMVKRVRYFKRVLDDAILCSKIRHGSKDEANEAYLVFEKRLQRFLYKFSNEEQTSLEKDDAQQGVRQGIVDAARRFDPTRKECASFTTVAYKWCFRNSRHRNEGDKRAGVYALSVESLRRDEDSDPISMITSSEGAFGSFSTNCDDTTLVMDLRSRIEALTEEQRTVITALMVGGNIAATAQKLKMKKSVVRRVRDQAFDRLRDTLGSYKDIGRPIPTVDVLVD